MRTTSLSLTLLALLAATGCSSTGSTPELAHHHDHDHGHHHHGHHHHHGPGSHTHTVQVAAPTRVDLTRLHQKLKDPTQPLRKQIASAMEAHDFLKVVALVDRLQKESPRDLWGAFMASDALVELGRYAEATAALQQVFDIKPCGAAYLRAGYLLHIRGEDRIAEELLTQALEPGASAKTRSFALHERGNLRWFHGDLDAAEADFRAALKLAPRSRQARVGLARVLAARGELALAATELAKKTTTPRLWGELALIERARGRPRAAARALRQARLLASRDAWHWQRSLAFVLADQAFLGDATIDTARAVELARTELGRRGSVHGWDALCWTLVADGKPAEAYAAAKRALVRGTQESLLLFHAGVAAARAGKRADAKRWLRRALSLNPTFHPLFPGLARDLLQKLEA